MLSIFYAKHKSIRSWIPSIKQPTHVLVYFLSRQPFIRKGFAAYFDVLTRIVSTIIEIDFQRYCVNVNWILSYAKSTWGKCLQFLHNDNSPKYSYSVLLKSFYSNTVSRQKKR